jgi:hypothetical protein
MKLTPYTAWWGHSQLLVQNITEVYQGIKSYCFMAEYELVISDGRTQTVSYHIEPLLNANKNRTGVVIVISDITDKKRLLTMLGQNNSLVSNLDRSIPISNHCCQIGRRGRSQAWGSQTEDVDHVLRHSIFHRPF